MTHRRADEPTLDPGIGLGAELPDDDGPAPPVTAGAVVRWVLRRQRGRIAVGAAAGIAWMGSAALVPVVLGQAIDRAVVDGGAGAVARWSIALAAVVLAGGVAGVVRHRAAVLLYVRTRWLLERLLTRRVLDPRGGVEEHPGRLLSLATSDAQRVGAIADLMCRGTGAVVTFLAVGTAMVWRSPLLGTVVLVGLPPALLALAPLWRPYDRRVSAQQAHLAEATAAAADGVVGLRVVKGLGAEPTVRRWFGESSRSLERSAVSVSRLEAAWTALAQAVPAVFLAVVIWLGGRLALDGALSAGELVTFTGLAAFLAIPLATFAEVGDVWAGGLASARRIARQLDAPVPIDDPVAGDVPLGGAVELRGVGHGPLLGLDLDVADGELVGIVAADPDAGAAVTDLLARRVDPDDGTVAVGGVDLRRLALDRLRAHVVVERGHHPWLLEGSLGDNVALGDPSASDDRVLAALTAAAGDDLTARHRALDHPVAERGLGLSGGQRQRVAVARALLPAPPVLVLEDPTSALDSLTEQRLAERLRTARRGRTTVVVTTSPTVLAHCDRVVLLDGGRVARSGRHDALLADPVYRAVVVADGGGR